MIDRSFIGRHFDAFPGRSAVLCWVIVFSCLQVCRVWALPPGVTLDRRLLSATDFEAFSLPPASEWRRFGVRVPDELNGYRFPAPAGSGWAFYGRHRSRPSWICITQDSDGAVAVSNEEAVLSVPPPVKGASGGTGPGWLFFQQGLVCACRGVLLFEASDTSEWEFYWIGVEKPIQPVELYPVDMEDGFMRLTFAEGDRWEKLSGEWSLKQYGGGMPTTEAEAKNANYRRASNAFTLVGSNGEAAYGRDDWVNCCVEARFFFGRPDSYAKRDTLVSVVLGGEPEYRDKEAIYQSNQIQEYPETDFWVSLGRPGGFRVAFGWSQAACAFQLRQQYAGSSQWETVREWRKRPYFGNWVKMGLGIVRGCRAAPFIDDDQLGTFPLDCVIMGPAVLIAGPDGKIETDDVCAYSYPSPSRLGARVFEQSRNFAQKELLETKDRQTGQWTRSELTFEEDEARLRGREMKLQRCQFPFYGNFTYRPKPELPEGDYCFALVDERERPYYTGFFTKTSRGWETPDGGTEFTLEIGRRKGHLLRRINGRWTLLTSRKVSSTVWIVIGTQSNEEQDPELHEIFSESLTHDFFEQAPSDWAWHEGNFRMDVRWQCQRGWNFMMGKSRDLAAMFSKTAYGGDQEIEFYIALRFVTPPPYYVLRDMGVAFCTDGDSLGSGYVLIYGDEDNTATTLLRNGEPVERVQTVIKHKPGGNIHNYWWHGRIRREGRLITVEIDDELVITFRDRNPLEGGHVAFWTSRNAISLAKVSINAERRKNEADRFLVDTAPQADTLWAPLNLDEVNVTATAGGKCRALHRSSGGTFAVRCRAPGKGLSLATAPVVTVPIKCNGDVRVGIHVQVSGVSYYYPYTSSLQGIRGLLTPQFENLAPDAIFRQKPFTEDEMKRFLVPGRHNSTEVTLDFREIARKLGDPRLESITVGNSSNEDYRMLGADGNPRGAEMVLGTPSSR